MQPDPAGQSDSRTKCHLLDFGFEFCPAGCRGVPDFNKTQHLDRTIQAPHRSDLPAHTFTNGLNDPGSRFIQRSRFGEDGSHGVLRRQAALRSLPSSNVSIIPYASVVNTVVALNGRAIAAEHSAIF